MSIPVCFKLACFRVYLFCRKFDFFPKGTAGADGWMSLYFKFADQFSDNQQIGFGFKLHVINFQFPSQTLTKGVYIALLRSLLITGSLIFLAVLHDIKHAFNVAPYDCLECMS